MSISVSLICTIEDGIFILGEEGPSFNMSWLSHLFKHGTGSKITSCESLKHWRTGENLKIKLKVKLYGISVKM